MKSFVIQRLERPGLTFLKVSGAIDENFTAGEIAKDLNGDVIFHLGRVTRFTSFGVREWISMLKSLKGKVRQCMLVECSPVVVNQINMIADFTGGAHVKSAQLPYLCKECGKDQLVTADLDHQRESLLSGQMPKVNCPDCKKPMFFDDLPDSYLAFLNDSSAPEPGSPMAELLARFERAAPDLGEGWEVLSAPLPKAIAASEVGDEPIRPARQIDLQPEPSSPARAEHPPFPLPSVLGNASSILDRAIRWSKDTWALVQSRREYQIRAAAAVLGLVLVLALLVGRGPPSGPRRGITAEELLQFNGLVSRERFAESEDFIRQLGSQIKEETLISLSSQLRTEKQSATDKHLTRAKALGSEGRYKEALDEVDAATSLAGPSEDALLLKVIFSKRRGDCASVLANASEFEETYPRSINGARVQSARHACMSGTKNRHIARGERP